ncbi:MAG: hypothetical protein ACE5FS_02870 [Paracoccaceae bacterium]
MPSANDGVVVLCMKWGTLYGPDYVNVLYAAVAGNLHRDFRFVCLTDDPVGIRREVECHPIPDHGFRSGEFAFGGWPKLSVFARDLYGLAGRALFLDLDTVIVGDITPLFDVPGELVMIREWKRFNDHFRPRRVRGMSSVFSFDLHGLPHLLERYLEDPAAARASVRHEQEWITKHAGGMSFWPDGWVVSFKRQLMAVPLVNRIVPPKPPPSGAKLVAFHGVPRPIDLVPDRGQHWGSFFRHGRGAVPWVREYWLRHGGQDVAR